MTATLRDTWPVLALAAFVLIESAVCGYVIARHFDRQPAAWGRT